MKSIIFNTEMVRAIQKGKKTQTRRPDKTGAPKWNVGDILLVDGTKNLYIIVMAIKRELLQDITGKDAKKEGILHTSLSSDDTCIEHFARLWDSIYEKTKYNWNSNPFVWVYEFERIEK